MGARTTVRLAALAAAAVLGGGAAWAAGGHHEVDDASILAPGECELESWASRARGRERPLHAGIGCGVGPVELGAAVEHVRFDDRSETAWNLEAKWAREVADGLSIGLDLQHAWQAHQRPRYAATQFAALATWSPRPDLALHLNLGRDFVHRGDDLPRHGVALEWSPVIRWWLTAERYLQERTHFVRAGVRWAPGRLWTVDLSHAHSINGPLPARWTLGVTFALDAD